MDITNAPLVAAYKRAQRNRFAVSKLMSKSAVSAETVPDQANTVEKMVDDFWRVHMMIVAARDPIRESEPEAHAKFQEVLAITAKWLE